MVSRGSRHARWLQLAWMSCAAAAGCEREPAAIAVELSGTPTAAPQVFHGGCLAGWSTAATLSVREITGVEVFLERFGYALRDQSSGLALGAEVLDGTDLEARYGARASVLPRRVVAAFRVQAVTFEPPSGPLEVSGELSGRDADGRPVRADFVLSAPIALTPLVRPPGGGACPSS